MAEYVGTKLDLIVAAGELFAENGLDGTSVRAIAERCNANIAAINYHFGSKENLHIEVLRHVIMQTRCPLAQQMLEDSRWFSSGEKMSEAVRCLVEERFRQYLSPEHPRWYGRLLMRSMLDPTPALEDVMRDIMIPENEALKQVFMRCKPGLTEEEADLWAMSLEGQVGFYVFAETGILMALDRNSYDREFLDAAADHIARLMISALGLPAICMDSERNAL